MTIHLTYETRNWTSEKTWRIAPSGVLWIKEGHWIKVGEYSYIGDGVDIGDGASIRCNVKVAKCTVVEQYEIVRRTLRIKNDITTRSYKRLGKRLGARRLLANCTSGRAVDSGGPPDYGEWRRLHWRGREY